MREPGGADREDGVTKKSEEGRGGGWIGGGEWK